MIQFLKLLIIKNYFKIILLNIFLLFIFFLALLIIPLDPLFEDLSFSQAVYDKNETLLRLTLSSDDKYRMKSNLNQLPDNFIDLILLKEDRYFYYHFGVNPISLVQAFIKSYIIGKRKVGASTITMQLARLRYKLKTRDIPGKVIQIFHAIQIEMRYSKNEILESYLSLLPFSNNIEGVDAASLIYFNKEIGDLDFVESLTLCVIPQSPYKRNLFIDGQKHLLNAKRSLLAKWIDTYNSHTDKKAFIDDVLPVNNINKLPFKTPQFVYHALSKYPKNKIITTTLDYHLHKQIHTIANNYIRRKKVYGIENCSLLLVDSRDMSVLSYLGSIDFYNESIDGQVDGTKAKRSPGSTLKPFIYAMAVDEGIIHPKSLMRDTIMNFGPYSPENYDGLFQGPVSAENALIRSRNIPAVDLQNRLKKNSLYDFIQFCDIQSRFPKEKYGLTLALGTMEMTIQDLVSLYGILANSGKWSPLVFHVDESPRWKQTVLSKEACHIVLKMLEKAKLSRDGNINDWTQDKTPVSWKTGTSIGYRDAWSIAVFNNYILAVWIGNFRGNGNPEFIGQKSASPLMFEIINFINNRYNNINNKKIEKLNIIELEVCSISGDQPNSNCPHRIKTMFIPGKSPIKRCKIHQSFLVNTKTGKRPCGSDVKNVESQVFEVWPGDLLEVFEKAGMKRKSPPDFDKNCVKTISNGSGFAPKMIYPIQKGVFIIDWKKKNQGIPLKALSDSRSNQLYWFANGAYIAKTLSGDVYMWKGNPGKYNIYVMDDNGSWAKRQIEIKVK